MTYVPTLLRQELKIKAIVTVHYFEYMRNFSFSGEAHDFWEFLYVDRGAVVVCADGNEIPMKTGDIIFHQPNEFHAIRAARDTAPCLVVVSFVSTSPILNHLSACMCALNMEEKILLSKLLERAQKLFLTPLNVPSVEQVQIDPDAPEGSEQMLRLLLELFLLTLIQRIRQLQSKSGRRRKHNTRGREELYRLHRLYEKDETNGRDMDDGELFDRVTAYLDHHIYANLSLSEIASDLSFSISFLEKLFYKKTGMGLKAYYNKLRIRCAKELIRENKLSISEIARLLSYSSPQYFSRSFKEQSGMTPREFQQSIRAITLKLGER